MPFKAGSCLLVLAFSCWMQAGAVVCGGLVMDIVARPVGSALLAGSSAPGVCSVRPGGVGRNVAEALARLSSDREPRPKLLAVVGNDMNGLSAVGHAESVGIDVGLLQRGPHISTPTYVAVLDERNDLMAAIADFRSVDDLDLTGPETQKALSLAPALVLDANLSPQTLEGIASASFRASSSSGSSGSSRGPSECGPQIVWWEPTSVAKCASIFCAPGFWPAVTHTSPNVAELSAMAHAAQSLVSGVQPDLAAASQHAMDAGARLEAAVSEAATQGKGTEVLGLLREPAEQVLQALDYAPPQGPTTAAQLPGTPQLVREARPPKRHLVVTLGAHGVVLVSSEHMGHAERSSAVHGSGSLVGSPTLRGSTPTRGGRASWFPARDLGASGAVDVTGAGDTLVAAALYQLLQGKPDEEAIAFGIAAAALSVSCADPVHPDLSDPESRAALLKISQDIRVQESHQLYFCPSVRK